MPGTLPDGILPLQNMIKLNIKHKNNYAVMPYYNSYDINIFNVLICHKQGKHITNSNCNLLRNSLVQSSYYHWQWIIKKIKQLVRQNTINEVLWTVMDDSCSI